MRWLFVVLLLTPVPASALPNMIRLGYGNCISCHVAPQGGGLLTAYGRGIDDAQSLRAREYEPHSNHVLNLLSVNGHIDQDARVIPSIQLNHSPGGPYVGVDKFRLFYRNVTTLGKGVRVSAIAEIENETTPRKPRAYDPAIRPGHVLFTSALLQYRPKDGIEFAAGRDALPTGLNIPDQTTFIKARNRAGYYDTPTQVKAFLWGKRWLVAPYVFAPGGHEPASSREKGEGIMAEYDVLGKGTTIVGINSLRGSDHIGHRAMSGAYTRLGFGKWGILAEHDLTLRRLSEANGGAAFWQRVSYLQLFYYPREWFAVAAVTERATVQRPYLENLSAYKGELSMRLSSNFSIVVRGGIQRDALTGVLTPIASAQLAVKSVN